MDRAARKGFACRCAGISSGNDALPSREAIPRAARLRGQRRDRRLRPRRAARRGPACRGHRRAQAELHPGAGAAGRRPDRCLRRGVAGGACVLARPWPRGRPACAQALPIAGLRAAGRVSARTRRAAGRAAAVAASPRSAPAGGSTRAPIMTAYRQRALICAAAMETGLMRTRDLRVVVADAPTILLRNVYGWFERVERGCYALTRAGRAALKRWPRSAYAPADEPRLSAPASAAAPRA